MKLLNYSLLLMIFLSCSTSKKVINTSLKDPNTFLITQISKDKTYGLSPKNPVQVGGVDKSEGPKNERRFLNALASPNGEKIYYTRAGSCCPIKSKKDPLGFGIVMLANYRVTWEGAKDTISIYLNMYDYGTLKAPV